MALYELFLRAAFNNLAAPNVFTSDQDNSNVHKLQP